MSRQGCRWVLAGAMLVATLALSTDARAGQNQQGACGNTDIKIDFLDTVYNAVNSNGEGKVGPRRLVVSQTGKVSSRGTRSFVQHTPMDIDEATIRIEKSHGRGETNVAICKTDENNHQTVLSRFNIPNGNSTPTFTRNLDGIKDDRISVRFEGHSITNSMSYQMFFERPNAGEVWEPTQEQLDSLYFPIDGFADLHAHHASRWAFGGGWYFGPMEGELPPDPPSHSRRLDVKLGGLQVTNLRPGHAGLEVPTWKDNSHQQMNSNALQGAFAEGLGLIVAPAVNSEWLCSILSYVKETDKDLSCQDMESAKYQILKMKRFDADNEFYDIVTNPWDAREASFDGRLPVVLGVEVSDIFPTSDGGWERQLDELYDMGVRVVYLAHETNSRFAGAAYHHTEDLKLPNQLKAWFSNEIKFASEGHGTRNSVGLTDLGENLVDAMMDRHMVIDIDHVSRYAVEEIYDIAQDRDYYPLYAGHTRISTLLPDKVREIIPELNTTPQTAEYIRQTGGMIGMRTGPEAMKAYQGSSVTNNCAGSVRSLVQTYDWISDHDIPAAFGSDLNGFVTTTAPRFGPDACPGASPANRPSQRAAQTVPGLNGAPPSWARYAERGLSDIGTEPALRYDMNAVGADTSNLEFSAEAFLDMWTRAYDPDRQIVP